ncbi:MAG: DUF881 domain-containing protein [Actinomycetota bacterium]|nr:DUF881 domain-containing protein [Actinomycetota bacterium]
MGGSPRIAVAVGAALLGFLAVLAATQPPRASRELRRLELADLIEAEDARVRSLRTELRDLRAQLDSMQREAGSTGAEAGEIRDRIEGLADAAGAAATSGPGITVTLDDSSSARSPTGDPNDLVVHERDIQTVVNALWAAGADAVGVDGERLTSTSAVRCAGNTLLLHGTVHSPPYLVTALGDPERLAANLERQPGMDRLRAAVEAFGLGLDVEAGAISMNGVPATLRFANRGRGV